jgi:hypothetical protein
MGHVPVLKPREVIARLEALGFVEVRQRGSHKQFRHSVDLWTAAGSATGSTPLAPISGPRRPGWTACGARASGIEGSLADRRADVEAELTDAGSGDAGDGVTSQRRGVAFSHSRDPAFRAL